MKVILARPRGVCAGVERAVKIVELALERFGAPIYVRKEIVHNRFIVDHLRQQGARFVDELDEVPAGALVIFSAHGISPAVREDADRRGLRTVDATCPLVSKVHLEVLRYVKRDYNLVLIGHEGHDEVVGTLGHAPASITLVTDVAHAERVELPLDKPLIVLTQTTLSVDDTKQIMAVLMRRFPQLETPGADDICYATQNRQNAVKALADSRIDLLLVVGSNNSSNAKRLVEVGESRGVPGYLIDRGAEIQPQWLQGVSAVGVTSGASTPEELVQDVVARLRELGATEVEVSTTVEEHVVFTLPPELRQLGAAAP
ncbi:MAG: 4-hydroxy-3-methylbut-2-enyl diphosphate reductase [Proteobacteria bacterium]|nr:4-hydroxy-3-methylbut-2-enyl diphosphate reductase [Pseudomonadota bacterium]